MEFSINGQYQRYKESKIKSIKITEHFLGKLKLTIVNDGGIHNIVPKITKLQFNYYNNI